MVTCQECHEDVVPDGNDEKVIETADKKKGKKKMEMVKERVLCKECGKNKVLCRGLCIKCYHKARHKEKTKFVAIPKKAKAMGRAARKSSEICAARAFQGSFTSGKSEVVLENVYSCSTCALSEMCYLLRDNNSAYKDTVVCKNYKQVV